MFDFDSMDVDISDDRNLLFTVMQVRLVPLEMPFKRLGRGAGMQDVTVT